MPRARVEPQDVFGDNSPAEVSAYSPGLGIKPTLAHLLRTPQHPTFRLDQDVFIDPITQIYNPNIL